MSATATVSTALLHQIATILGVPVTTFTAPPSEAASDAAPGAVVAQLLFDADGRRLAAAFVEMPSQGRTALANVAEALRRDLPRTDADPAHASQRR